jgi:hypothetical protein
MPDIAVPQSAGSRRFFGSLGRLTIARKLPLAVMAAALISATVVGVTSYRHAASTMRHEVEVKSSAPMQVRRSALEDYLNSIRQDLRILAGSETVLQAAGDFRDA